MILFLNIPSHIFFCVLLLAQLSRCAYTIIFCKPYIASLKIWKIGLWTVERLEIWTIGLWTVGPFDYILIQMDDYPADSCAISHTAFLFCSLLDLIHTFSKV